MKFSYAFIALALPFLAATSLAAPTSNYVVHESRDFLPSGWVKSLKIDGRQRIPMKFGLKQNNIENMDDILMDVSDPTSPNYSKHLNAQQVVDLFAPQADTVDAVRAWLVDSGIGAERIKQSKNKLWLEFEALVEEAEALLKTEYNMYHHAETGTAHLASGMAYSLPEHISEHVDIVMPTMHFDIKLKPTKYEFDDEAGHLVQRGSVNGLGGKGAAEVHNIINTGSSSSFGPKISGKPFKQLFDQLANCSITITPICLEALYKFSPDLQLAADKNSFGVVEYSPVGVLNSDLLLFQSNYSQRSHGYLPTYVYPDDGSNPQVYGQTNELVNKYAEGNLDAAYAIALTYPVPITVYQVGPQDGSASFNTFLDAIDSSYCTYEGGDDTVTGDPVYQGACGAYKPTNVISTSYGYNEADLPLKYEQRQCNEYAKLGLQGVSFLFSSGDNGVAGNSAQCIDPGFTGYNNGGSGIFNPSFPGTCAYVTSVGATQIPAGKKVTDPECATYEVIYSGGGASNNFLMPSYQKAAVANYYAKHAPPYTAAQYNNSQQVRMYPDVSANGARYALPIEGQYYHLYGTSASSPTFGSIVTLLNGARIAIGKSPLGFLNPWLYQNSWILTDITNGTNPGCGTQGFSAVPGWDPVTGLGTPNYPLMLASAVLQ